MHRIWTPVKNAPVLSWTPVKNASPRIWTPVKNASHRIWTPVKCIIIIYETFFSL